MSSTTEHEHQAVASADASQSIAAASKKRSTPRTAVGLPADPDRHYDLAELRACGFDAMAATIVHHVAYNTKRNKRPVACTSSYWIEYFGGCTKKQVRTAVKNALAAKIDGVTLLEITHDYFQGVWSPFYRHVGPRAQNGTPDAQKGTPYSEGNQQKETENLNTQFGPGKTTPGPETEHQVKPVKTSGNISPKTKPQASPAFLDLCRTRKVEWLAATTNINGDSPAGCILPTLTDTDLSACQRLEYRLTEAGVDPMGFLDWLTCYRFQQITLGDLWDDPAYSPLWLGKRKHQILLIERYREHLAQAQETPPETLAEAPATAVAPDIPEPVVSAPGVSASGEWDPDEDRPLSQAEMDLALARWMPAAAAAKKAADEVEAQRKAARHLVADVPMPTKAKTSKPEPNMFQHHPKVAT